MTDKTERRALGLQLGWPFDQLFNRECKQESLRDDFLVGLSYPDDGDPGSGNIVIQGKAGTGKSTLAMQLAVRCCQTPNNQLAAYIALEQSVSAVMTKARMFGWQNWFKEIRHPQVLDETASTEDMAELFLRVVTQSKCDARQRTGSECGKHCPDHIGRMGKAKNPSLESPKIDPQVLLLTLSPRPFSETAEHDLFDQRFLQLEHLLVAARHLRRKQPGKPALRLVCIDSLSMFSAGRPPSREEMFRLFDLCRRQEAIGVFLVEGEGQTPFDSTIADIVVTLEMQREDGYVMRTLEIEKSRYVHQVYGKHPYQIISPQEAKSAGCGNDDLRELPQFGLNVFPSLHYLVATKEATTNRANPKEEPRITGPLATVDGAFERILPKWSPAPGVYTIEGPQGTFKSALAFNFLAAGLEAKESAILIRLNDRPRADDITKQLLSRNLAAFDLASLAEESDTSWKFLGRPSRAEIVVRRHSPTGTRLITIDFKSGALVPEEFVQILRNVIQKQCADKKSPRIRRVVLDDVSLIGVSYPHLRKSSTAGELFLPTFVHLMRKYGFDLVMTGTTGELDAANDSVNRAVSLADSVVSCRFCDVFGDRHVIVRGEGLMAEGPNMATEGGGESAPAVIRWDQRVLDARGEGRLPFYLDLNYLQGFVGFETNNIHRPGIALHLFEEYHEVGLHAEYNRSLRTLLTSAYGQPTTVPDIHRPHYQHQPADIRLNTFDSAESQSIHDSFWTISSGPLSRTVISTIDEFYFADKAESPFADIHKPGKNDYFVTSVPPSVIPFYANVLLLAFRKDLVASPASRPSSWPDVVNLVDRMANVVKSSIPAEKRESEAGRPPVNVAVCFDHYARETLSCALIDALIAGQANGKTKGRAIFDNDFFENLQKSLSAHCLEELTALSDFFFMSNWQIGDSSSSASRAQRQRGAAAGATPGDLGSAQGRSSEKSMEEHRGLLRPDAAVYLCWYSQLRELIDRHPGLAEHLGVCSLPGGGFTGDWYLGVAKRSVSHSLGKSVALLLCSEQEEYKRFAKGVGLPVRQKFYDKAGTFLAWPRAGGVTLQHIAEIYRGAFQRASLSSYKLFHSAIATAAGQCAPTRDERIWLVGEEGDKAREARKERIEGVVKRMIEQILLLKRA